ncbi:hypothetical protein LCGC14_1143400 [marine sediment metagenome]|uniref:Glycosyltransferase RgtA/B/C/D-like domain-containing protein n=1 Tax=marine sediment metagenome TaxID=412755 RepID=A0A0F9LXP0_9ZZZZ
MSEEENHSIQSIFTYIFVIITIALILIRIISIFYEISPWVEATRDIDFKILIEGMDNGLINFYDPISISDWPPYYLYFWYFLFFPIYIMPFNISIGVYIWDALRLILTIIVVRKAPTIFKSKKDLLIFYIFGSIGYTIDAYYNNVNFIIVFLLFFSFYFMESDKFWKAGFLFTLATFKITAIVFLPVLLIIKKLKWKDLKYFLIPFLLICIPYIIFPDYLFQMVKNWGHSDVEIKGILFFDSVLWKALQPSHLMFIGLLFIIFIENIKNANRKKNLRIILVSLITIYYVYLTSVVFIIPVILN